MSTQQGDLSLLDDPVAQQLLQSPFPARLAYIWTDGTPRVVPIGFHWNGRELVFCTVPDSPKMKVLADGVHVAVEIDTNTCPGKVLLVRGPVHTDLVDGVAPEYEAMCRRGMDEEAAQQWVATMAILCPRETRIFVTPEWVGILDFETRFPSAMERAMERMGAVA